MPVEEPHLPLDREVRAPDFTQHPLALGVVQRAGLQNSGLQHAPRGRQTQLDNAGIALGWNVGSDIEPTIRLIRVFCESVTAKAITRAV